jgi:DNA-binding transcriptional regulator LsrR (DeoR family)
VARLYYVQDMTKQEIGEQLGLSRFKIARLLEQARARGIVRFEISDSLSVDVGLGRSLAERYGLDLAVVSDGDDAAAVAGAAAAWIPDLLPPEQPVGVAWGSTLQQVADQLPQLRSGRPVVQICGVVPELAPGTGPTELAMRFAERIGDRMYALAAPALTGPAAHRDLLVNDVLRPTLAMFDRLGAAIVGIGQAARFPGAPPSAAGHILVHLFDEAGEPVVMPFDGHALSLNREQLAATRVIAVAGGDGKERAITGALRSGMVNVLFTDRGNAEHALRAAGS